MPRKTRSKPHQEMSFISLFSGCGGLDLGFQQAGFRCLGAFDNDYTAIQTHSENLGTPTFQWDLSNGQLPDKQATRPMVVVAGSPCQGFSTIGKRRVDDKRNGLLLAAGRIAVALNPAFFVAENVPAVTSGAHAKYWDSLRHTLTDAGYTCSTVLLRASDFGVAQQRRRLFMIASRKLLRGCHIGEVHRNGVSQEAPVLDLQVRNSLEGSDVQPLGREPRWGCRVWN